MSRTGKWRRLGSNALANIFAGASIVFVQLGLTAIAARSFEPTGFAAWTVLQSLAAMTPLFGASLTVIVTRCLVSSPGVMQAAAIMAASRKLAWRLSGLALVALALIALLLVPHSEPLAGFPWELVLITAIVMIGSQLWQIALQPAIGWHFSRENNWAATAATVSIRMASLLAMLVAWKLSPNDLLRTALYALAASAIVTTAVRYARFGPAPAVELDAAVLQHKTQEIRGLAKAFAVWAAGSAAIQFGLPAIMSVLASGGYSAFFLAYTLNTVIMGVLGAVTSAMLAPVTRQLTEKNFSSMARWFVLAPAMTGAILLSFLTVFYFSISTLLEHWTPGITTAAMVAGYLYILGFQTIARNLTLIFAVVLSSVGKPRQVVVPILLEIALTVFLALPAGLILGDRAFLVGLAGAGLVTSLLTTHITVKLVVESIAAQRKIQWLFLLAQLVTLSCWFVIGM